MSFPNIITDKPTGSEYVSKIDDFERETRSWLERCMKSVSGYPTVETINRRMVEFDETEVESERRIFVGL